VARLAISLPGVIESSVAPITGIMAVGALPAEVTGRAGMAGLAIVLPGVIESGVTPVAGVVAVGALPAKVVGWS
jgi:hypothetical protein